MMRYSVKPTDLIFLKCYGFLSFAKNMGRNIGKNMGRNIGKIIKNSLSGKYSQKSFDRAKQSATDAFKTASAIQKTADTTGYLLDIKISDKNKKDSRKLPQNN